MKIDARHCNAYSGNRIEIFFEKKYVAISQRAGAHVGERILLLSATCRSYRQNCAVCVRILVLAGTGMYRHVDQATSDIQEQKPLSADVQAATLMSLCALLGGWHDRGGWPGLGARVELGD